MNRNSTHIFIFLTATLAALLLGGFFLSCYSKSEIHIFINNFNSPVADVFFKYVTYLGEGWMFVLALPAMLFFSWRSGISIALAGIFTGIFTGIFKNGLYHGAPRPIEFFNGDFDLHLVENVEMNHWNSFPSGHTMAAFSLCFVLALLIKKWHWSVVLFIVAFLVGYSRMYLSQHFLVDVVVGAGLGIFAATAAFIISSKLPVKGLEKRGLDLF